MKVVLSTTLGSEGIVSLMLKAQGFFFVITLMVGALIESSYNSMLSRSAKDN
jgi:hypothetical protein